MIHLVDFQNTVYRYASATNLSVKVNGVEVSTSVLYGLVKYCKSLQYPTIFCVEGQPKVFKQLYPQYKGNRNKEKDESVQVPISDVIAIAYLVAKMSGAVCKFAYSPFQEADQVVASLTYAAKNPRLQLFGPQAAPEDDYYFERYRPLRAERFPKFKSDQVLIKSTDSDMTQLMALGGVRIATKLSDNEGSYKTPKAVQHVSPELIPVYKAFQGDVSDNIPSVIDGFSKKRFEQIMSDVIEDSKDLEKFIRMTRLNERFEGAVDLQKFIRDNGKLTQLSINHKISALGFYSMPYELVPPEDYDLLKKLNLYHIRL